MLQTEIKTLQSNINNGWNVPNDTHGSGNGPAKLTMAAETKEQTELQNGEFETTWNWKFQTRGFTSGTYLDRERRAIASSRSHF